jgi:hypothetical protein
VGTFDESKWLITFLLTEKELELYFCFVRRGTAGRSGFSASGTGITRLTSQCLIQRR